MLGNANNGGQRGNNNQQKDIEVYSQYRFFNYNGELEKTSLSATFWRGLLKLSIAPKRDGEDMTFDHSASIDIYLTHIKARILYDEICLFQSDPYAYKNVGVDTRLGRISISNGKEYGIDHPCIVIRRVDDRGAVEASTVFEIRKGMHYAIRNFSDKDPNGFDRVYYDDLDLEIFKTLLKEYSEAMTGAIAYSIMEESKYNDSRTQTKLNAIAEKLGVDYTNAAPRNNGGGGGYNQQYNNSRNNSGNNRQFSQSSIDELSNKMR